MPNPRLPSELKKLKGTWNSSRENPEEPSLEWLPVPDAPEDMKGMPREIWERLKLAVDALGVFTAADLPLFQAMVRARVNYERIWNTDPMDQKEFIAASKEVRSYMVEFGLSPASRARVKALVGRKATNDIDEFFSDRN